MTSIMLEIKRSEKQFFKQDLSLLSKSATEIEATRFDGVLLIQILTTINTVTLPILAKIVVEAIRAKRYIVVKKDGIEIRGLSEESALSILQALDKE